MIKRKQIYFVRHGESELNALNVRQGREGHLSALGREQAAFVAERFTNIPIDIILASPYVRTQETAGIIQQKIKVPMEPCELLAERRNPKEIIGRRSDDPEVAAIIDRIDRSFHMNELRYSDEENFEDLKNRAKSLLRFLESRPEQQILCVTHYIFLETLASYIEVGEELTSHQVAKYTFLNSMNNAGITLCTFNDPRGWLSRKQSLTNNEGWKVLVWNDYGRLKEEEEEEGTI